MTTSQSWLTRRVRQLTVPPARARVPGLAAGPVSLQPTGPEPRADGKHGARLGIAGPVRGAAAVWCTRLALWACGVRAAGL